MLFTLSIERLSEALEQATGVGRNTEQVRRLLKRVVVHSGHEDGVARHERGRFCRRRRKHELRHQGSSGGTGFHSLRHFYVSLLIRHGESVKVVQVRLGHASAAETLDTYSPHWPDSEDRTRAALDEVLGPRVSPACHA